MELGLPLTKITTSNSAFVVPAEKVAELGGGGRPKVVVTVEGVTWRTSIAPMGGRHLIGLTKAQHAQTGVEDGTTYLITVVLDEAPRVVEVPDDLAEVLAADERAKAVWQRWSYTRQKEAAAALTGAKKPETPARRLAKIVADLGGS